MNKLIITIGLLFAFGCVGVQSKLADAKSKAKDLWPKVECRAKVVEPYVDYILSADLPAVLAGADIDFILEAIGVGKDEFDKVKSEFAACGKL